MTRRGGFPFPPLSFYPRRPFFQDVERRMENRERERERDSSGGPHFTLYNPPRNTTTTYGSPSSPPDATASPLCFANMIFHLALLMVNAKTTHRSVKLSIMSSRLFGDTEDCASPAATRGSSTAAPSALLDNSPAAASSAERAATPRFDEGRTPHRAPDRFIPERYVTAAASSAPSTFTFGNSARAVTDGDGAAERRLSVSAAAARSSVTLPHHGGASSPSGTPPPQLNAGSTTLPVSPQRMAAQVGVLLTSPGAAVAAARGSPAAAPRLPSGRASAAALLFDAFPDGSVASRRLSKAHGEEPYTAHLSRSLFSEIGQLEELSVVSDGLHQMGDRPLQHHELPSASARLMSAAEETDAEAALAAVAPFLATAADVAVLQEGGRRSASGDAENRAPLPARRTVSILGGARLSGAADLEESGTQRSSVARPRLSLAAASSLGIDGVPDHAATSAHSPFRAAATAGVGPSSLLALGAGGGLPLHRGSSSSQAAERPTFGTPTRRREGDNDDNENYDDDAASPDTTTRHHYPLTHDENADPIVFGRLADAEIRSPGGGGAALPPLAPVGAGGSRPSVGGGQVRPSGRFSVSAATTPSRPMMPPSPASPYLTTARLSGGGGAATPPPPPMPIVTRPSFGTANAPGSGFVSNPNATHGGGSIFHVVAAAANGHHHLAASSSSAGSHAIQTESDRFRLSPAVVYAENRQRHFTSRSFRVIPQTPERILDAPELLDDFYLNLIDWSSTNVMAVALGSTLYLWNADSGTIQQLCKRETTPTNLAPLITGVNFHADGTLLAVGTFGKEVQVWDTQVQKQVHTFTGHDGRVGSLSWNGNVLASGSRDATIMLHDTRTSSPVATYVGHTQEVCGLKWSPNGQQLASGGNDNLLNIWEFSRTEADTRPLFQIRKHCAAIKALAWNPVRSHLLVSGGGTADKTLRFWDTTTGDCINLIDTNSQVCGVLWNHEGTELVSSHGYSDNQLTVWRYPSLKRVTDLTGHGSRVLHLAMSPDGETVVSAAGDETIRFWRCFGRSTPGTTSGSRGGAADGRPSGGGRPSGRPSSSRASGGRPSKTSRPEPSDLDSPLR